MKFITKNSGRSSLHIAYKEKYIEERVTTKFVSLQIDNQINCKNHIEQIIPKLSAACYAIRSMAHISNINILKSVSLYYKYGIIFGVTLLKVGSFSLYK